jgi:LPXTG-site transpeptidase (sortase) family protein
MTRRVLPVLALLVGVALIGGAVLVLWHPGSKSNASLASLPPPSPIISPLASVSPQGPGSEVPPEGMRIKIAQLGLDLPVVAGDGVNAPLFKAVLYPWLAQPGSGKRSMIYAHARTGMFGPLFQAKVGQVIEIDRPQAAPGRYVISEYYPAWKSTDVRWLQPANQEQLILVTCTTYNENDPRIIVVAKPAGS